MSNDKPLHALAPIKDASGTYGFEVCAYHAERPGFRMTEIELTEKQQVPWHYHNHVQDTFYVLSGEMRLFLQNPKQEVRLKPGETYSAAPSRPHLVTNAGKAPMRFFVLQGIGEYDYVPLVPAKGATAHPAT
jgi:quercetin dioxygenase-like cupin family protein